MDMAIPIPINKNKNYSKRRRSNDNNDDETVVITASSAIIIKRNNNNRNIKSIFLFIFLSITGGLLFLNQSLIVTNSEYHQKQHQLLQLQEVDVEVEVSKTSHPILLTVIVANTTTPAATTITTTAAATTGTTTTTTTASGVNASQIIVQEVVQGSVSESESTKTLAATTAKIIVPPNIDINVTNDKDTKALWSPLSSSTSSSLSTSLSTEARSECLKILDRTRKAIQNDPERNAIPALMFFNDNVNNNYNNNNSRSNNIISTTTTTTTITRMEEEEHVRVHVPGLSNDLLRKIIHGKKVAIIGDSTLRNLVRWWVRLYDEKSTELSWMMNNSNNNNSRKKKKQKQQIKTIIDKSGRIVIDDGSNSKNININNTNSTSTSSLYHANKDILRIARSSVYFTPCPICDNDNKYDDDDIGKQQKKIICTCDPMKLEKGFLRYYDEEEIGNFDDDDDDDNDNDNDNKSSTIETEIRYFQVNNYFSSKFQPDIVVFNSGLWLLHLFGARNLPTTESERNAVKNWIHYEDTVLRRVIDQARQSNTVKVLLFKTTNMICDQSYNSIYKEYIDLYNSNSNNNSDINNTKILMECKNHFLELLKKKKENNSTARQLLHDDDDDDNNEIDNDDRYLEDNINNYCMNGTLSEKGSNHLNRRLVEFVNNFNANNINTNNKYNTNTHNIATNGSGSGINSNTHKNDNDDNNNNNNMVIQIFNDHDIQNCSYTNVGDGRHFQGLNLPRIRLLLNQLDCIL